MIQQLCFPINFLSFIFLSILAIGSLPNWAIAVIVIASIAGCSLVAIGYWQYRRRRKLQSMMSSGENVNMTNKAAVENGYKSNDETQTSSSQVFSATDKASLKGVTLFDKDQLRVMEKLGEGHFSTVRFHSQIYLETCFRSVNVIRNRVD